MITDMTKGKPFSILWRFTLPMLVSVIFQQLYNIVDSVVAGQYIGAEALAAVGASYPITMIFMAVATGINIGASVVVSQLFGAKDNTRMKTAVNTALFFTVAISLLLTGLGLLLCQPLLRALGTPDNIFADSALYLNIYIFGLLFLFLYNICTGIFTALGDSRTPLYFLIASSIGNIVLDVLFVVVFHMGVAGVAWATFLAQGVSSMLAAVTLHRRLRAIPHDRDTLPQRFSLSMLGRICSVAVPSILQQSFISVGNLLIQWLVNGYGSDVIAGYSAAIKLNTFALTSITAMSSSLSSFVAQNVGAGRADRVRQGYKSGVFMGMGVALLFTAALFGFSDTMIGFFNDSAGVLAVGVEFLHIVAPFYIVISIKLMSDSVLRGASDMMAFMIATFFDLILRIVLAFIFSRFWAQTGIWLSWPFGWVAGALMSVGFYLSGRWKRRIPATNGEG